jgi:hypothetical protein
VGVGFEIDKPRSDIFIPTIKKILGLVLIEEATLEEDQKQNTDLVFRVRSGRVSCRVRDAGKYLKLYSGEFTIRRSRPSGVPSEWDKFIDGFGDFMFYGFGDFSTGKIVGYTVIDLHALRAQMIRSVVEPSLAIRFIQKPNTDGSSDFVAIDIDSLQPACIKHRFMPYLRAA